MKKLCIALAAIIALASCKKENVTTPGTTPVPIPTVVKSLVKATTVYTNSPANVKVYSYDAAGKIKTITADGLYYSFDFTSSASLMVTLKLKGSSNILTTYECALNGNGNITKMTAKLPNGSVSEVLDYTYDANGYIANKKSNVTGGGITNEVHTVIDGNLVSITSSSNGVANDTESYSYDNTKLNKTTGVINGYWDVKGLFGKAPKNMLTEYKSVNTAGSVTNNIKYDYVFDADGYPVKRNSIYVLQNGITTVDNFEYQ